MSLGDPTSYGNMLPPAEASEAINEAFAKPTSHGYVPSCGKLILSYLNHSINIMFYIGTEEAREAVAKLWSRDGFALDSKVNQKYLSKLYSVKIIYIQRILF